ncbi:MAG TPA: SRPBCC family protein, partial [Anaeromyxobacteraceae bacterium]|nr:SRPBCC family protein [Anaeromyxobacteraceae bacterium]
MRIVLRVGGRTREVVVVFVERTGGWFRRGWRIGLARPRGGGAGVGGPVSAFALGAGLMYLLDPRRGASRRAALKSRAAHAVRATEALVESGARDLEQRARGGVASAASRLRRDDADDGVVAERVRARLGRHTSHAHAIHVAVRNGQVELTGPVLSSEWQRVVDGVKRVRGVRGVTDRLEAHASPAGVSALQGGGRRPGRGGLARDRWAPGTRLAAGGAGVYLLANGVGGGGLLGLPAAVAGLALLARAAANAPVGRSATGGAEIHVRKSIAIAQPVDEVYAFFTEFQNLPRFMSHVREVRATGPNRTRWSVDGPGGVPVEWEAVATAQEPNRLVAWESEPGSVVRTAGSVRFEEDGAGTRMEVTLRYHPPAGALGHAVARLLGADPKRQLDDDLVRLKSLLERGKATGREGTVTLAELKSAETMGASSLTETPVGDPASGVHA